ncbi:hypothetical protein HYC85_018292 [Camellia sinensis]|uniref:Uncharacterized protein n=1 Tax=Camellia sinensis TaxID=4442 RepID=A0A7J7GVL0_CAMSI|nr:hypothetical protein HYC85_018292 [Camellia sinensis]
MASGGKWRQVTTENAFVFFMFMFFMFFKRKHRFPDFIRLRVVTETHSCLDLTPRPSIVESDVVVSNVMGLPQVSSSESAEEATESLRTSVHSPPRFVNVSTCDLDGMHVGSIKPNCWRFLMLFFRRFSGNNLLGAIKVVR